MSRLEHAIQTGTPMHDALQELTHCLAQLKRALAPWMHLAAQQETTAARSD
jgi:hypothetical protein